MLPATPRRKTLFEKNFLDLPVDGCLLRASQRWMVGALGGALLCLLPAACFPEELSRSFCGGMRIGTPTMPSACCLLHRRRKTFFGMNFLDLFHTVCAHWQAHCYAYCLLPVSQKNFLDLSVEGRALGRLRCLLRAACSIEEEKLFLG